MLKKFEPSHFFETAEFLREKANSQSIKGDDGYLRSSISRYYYAALICARDKYNLKTRGASGHQTVLDFFDSQSNTTEEGMQYKMLYDNLNTLKGLREKADYESRVTCQTRDCNQSRSLSEQVLAALNSF